MDFVEFVNLTRSVIGGKSGIHTYVKTLFDAMLTEDGKDILDDYSISTYKAYANGTTREVRTKSWTNRKGKIR